MKYVPGTKDNQIPLMLNFRRRIGTARVTLVDGDCLTVTCEVPPELAELVRELGPGTIGEVNFTLRPAQPCEPEGQPPAL